MRFGIYVLGVALLGLVVGCGSDDAASTGVSTLDALPKATSAVSTAASSSLQSDNDFNAIGLYGANSELQAATTGLKLKDVDNVTWNSGKSGACCENASKIRSLLAEASEADKILCYLGEMEKLGLFTNSYDGTDKLYKLTGMGAEAFNIKFKIVRDANNKITSFDMYMCQGSTQDSYVGQTITAAGAVTVTSVGTYSQGTASSNRRITVSGNVNTSGVWSDKAITAKIVNVDSGGGNFTMKDSFVLTQHSDRFDLVSLFSGAFSGTNFTGLINSYSQVLNGSSLTTIAVGEGSAKYSMDHNGDSTFEEQGTDSWNGDTYAKMSDATASDYYTLANGSTLTSVAAIATPSFTAAETWNCSGTFTTVNMATVDQTAWSCDTDYGFGESRGGATNCQSAAY